MNGSHSPQCFNCKFFHQGFFPKNPNVIDNRRWCKKHDFIMPDGIGELICSDWLDKEWLRQKNKASDYFANLEPGFLYHYFYFSADLPVIFQAFSNIQNLFIPITINKDDELEWIALDFRTIWFPKPDQKIMLWIDENNYQFEVIDIPRSYVSGSTLLPSGERQYKHTPIIRRVLHCPSSPDQLYQGLNTAIDLDRYLANETRRFAAEDLGFFAFLEIVEKDKVYRLHANSLNYKDYRR